MASQSMRLIGALSLGLAVVPAFACDLPKLPVIPAAADIGDSAPAVSAATSAYFEGMRAYVACVEGELTAAGGDAAPPSVKAVLVARNNAAVAEAQAIQKLFAENVGAAQAAPRGTDAALRKLIAGLASGMPDYDSMTSAMQSATRQQLRNLQRETAALGELRTLAYGGVDRQGHDVYQAQHENGSTRWSIGLDADGKINFALVQRNEPGIRR